MGVADAAEWLKSVEQALLVTDLGRDLTAARNLQKKHAQLAADYAAHQVILQALKRYGAFVADNGVGFMITGAPDPRWSDSDLHNLQQITASDFEVVRMGSVTPWP